LSKLSCVNLELSKEVKVKYGIFSVAFIVVFLVLQLMEIRMRKFWKAIFEPCVTLGEFHFNLLFFRIK
jgi:hypothetical protein